MDQFLEERVPISKARFSERSRADLPIGDLSDIGVLPAFEISVGKKLPHPCAITRTLTVAMQ